jgi:cell division protein FtsB
MDPAVRNGVRIAEGLIFAVAFSAACLLLGEEGLSESRRLTAKKVKLETENHSLGGEIRLLERQVKLLRTDAGSVERAAKARLGMAGKDETVYVFNGTSPGSQVDLVERFLDTEGNRP